MSKSPTHHPQQFANLIECLQHHASVRSQQAAFLFLSDGERDAQKATYAQLDKYARIIGAMLQQHGLSHKRVLLIYPPGLDFVFAFWGCIYSQAIAVPIPAPEQARLQRTLPRLQAVAKDVAPTAVLTTAAILSDIEQLSKQAPELASLQWYATDNLAQDQDRNWYLPQVCGKDLAHIQYSSGSTSAPKGVMVSNDNLFGHCRAISHACRYTQNSIAATWMPHFHDYCLVEAIVHPGYRGILSILLPPLAFIQKPCRWLQAISKYKVTNSFAPNFAYELCVRKVLPEQRAQLDLSNWQVAANAAEPVRKATIDRFIDAYRPQGFKRSAFYPSYGLAEATLYVSTKATPVPVYCTVQTNALEQHRIVESAVPTTNTTIIVGCGQPFAGTTVAIVDPDTLATCPADRVGEIWISSAAVAQGYWERPQETAETFGAYLQNGEGPFLRTGDLGFIKDQELFVTGRRKDLLIIRGQNHYPQDIEWTVHQACPQLRAGCIAVFSIDVEEQECLVVVAEVKKEYVKYHDQSAKLATEAQPIVDNICRALASVHNLQVYAIALIKPKTIFKTSSGKLQRFACRAAFAKNTLQAIYQWQTGTAELPRSPAAQPLNSAVPHIEQISAWLTTQICQRLQIPEREIDIHRPFATMGIDSAQAVAMTGDIETWLQRKISPTIMYNYPNIDALARYLILQAPNNIAPPAIADEKREPLAIIGMGCRFPGANTPAAFWHLLHEQVDAVSEIPATRWENNFYDPQGGAGKMKTRWAGLLAEVDCFDADFFGISAREAVCMDPQQRLLLEVTWEALEDVALVAQNLTGTQTGVFIGIATDDYGRMQLQQHQAIDIHAATGSTLSIAANRLSYYFDWKGPSMAVDTACSSSLVAVHLACRSLHSGECTLAVAGGVNLLLAPELSIAFSQANFMASDGRCKAYDADADGYVRGEGCGVVILKRLSQAIQDRDRILATIQGSAVNQDGRSNGLTAPSGLAQQAVIRNALRDAGANAADISYIETHGTGTALGDPIEIQALANVFCETLAPCIIGSVKTNIGHLEAAAGIAGLIKVVLSLQHRKIPAHLHLRTVNPHIHLQHTPFTIADTTTPWPQRPVRMAGISSFGFGGTNAHAIVKEYDASRGQCSPCNNSAQVFLLSAKRAEQLRHYAAQMHDFLTTASTNQSLADIAYTLQCGRQPMAARLAIVAGNTQQLVEKLYAAAHKHVAPGLFINQIPEQKVPKIAWLFSSEGMDYAHIGSDLYHREAVFHRALQQCDHLLRSYFSPSFLEILYSENSAGIPFPEAKFAKAVAFSVEYALAELWRSWGIQPDVVMGRGVGELVAACTAGKLSVEEALQFIATEKNWTAPVAEELPAAIKFIPNMGEELTTCDIYMEIGAASRLLTKIRRSHHRPALWLASMPSHRQHYRHISAVLGMLYVHGVNLHRKSSQHKKISLPTYPFSRKSYWLPQDSKTAVEPRQTSKKSPSYFCSAIHTGTHFWEIELDSEQTAYLRDHIVSGTAIVPATYYLSMLVSATYQAFDTQNSVWKKIAFKKVLSVVPDSQTLQLIITPEMPETVTFQFLSCNNTLPKPSSWELHAVGAIHFGEQALGPCRSLPPLATVRKRSSRQISSALYYQTLKEQGLDYGVRFQGIKEVWYRRGEAVARLALPPQLEAQDYQLHPVILDCCLQVLWSTLPRELQIARGTYIPIGIDSLQVHNLEGTGIWAYAILRSTEQGSPKQFCGDLFLLDKNEKLLVEICGLRMQSLHIEIPGTTRKFNKKMYEIRWQRQQLPATNAALPSATGKWLIFADSDVGPNLHRAIPEASVVVYRGESYQKVSADSYRLNAHEPRQFRQLLQDIFDEHACLGVIHLWSLDITPLAQNSIAAFAEHQLVCMSVVYMVQALVRSGWRNLPRVWLLTGGVHSIGPPPRTLAPIQAPLWGLGRTIAHEYPQLQCSQLDIAPQDGKQITTALINELVYNNGENQIAFRGGARYVARFVQNNLQAPTMAKPKTIFADEPFCLQIKNPGILDNLSLQAVNRTKPRPGEVEISVNSAGINFIDVMKAMGIYPGIDPDQIQLGSECAGKIVAIGEDVDDFQIGDEVIAIGSCCFGPFVTTAANLVLPKPKGLDFAAAATIPIVFFTAYYALIYLGRMRPQERVLIHAAAGGVGLAAIQIAQQVGAEVFATAGTEEKRQYLRSIGVNYVMDSRSLTFAEEIMQCTNREGVDLVLNSLAGEAIPRSLSTLATCGRFLEIGKRDIYQNSRLSLEYLRKNISFFTIDLAQMITERPLISASLFQETLHYFGKHKLQPLRHKVFPISRAVDAFRYMAGAKHIGKIVLALQDSKLAKTSLVATPITLSSQATYLLTGGWGGLGLITAKWMLEQGARYLVLVGKNPAPASAIAELKAVATDTAQLQFASANVADENQLKTVLEKIRASMPPLRGIIHAAGTLDDCMLMQLNSDSWHKVMAPKIIGAWNLHSLTLSENLDFFIMFSSVASVLGSPGQSNYAAANAFLDALAAYRHQHRQPATSIQWGPWANVGMTAINRNAKQSIVRGIRTIPPEQGIAMLKQIFADSPAQIAVLSFNLRQWRQANPQISQLPFLQELMAQQLPDVTEGKAYMHEKLMSALPQKRHSLLEKHLQEQAAEVLRVSPSRLETQTSLGSIGFDSLLGLEFRNRLEASLGITLPATLLWAYPTIADLTIELAKKMDIDLATTPDPLPDGQDTLSKLEQLSDAEVADLLNKKFPDFNQRDC